MLAQDLKEKNINKNCKLFCAPNIEKALVEDLYLYLSSHLAPKTINIAVSGGSVGERIWPKIASCLKHVPAHTFNIYLCDERYTADSSQSNADLIKSALALIPLSNCTLFLPKSIDLFPTFEKWVDDYNTLLSEKASLGMDICILGIGEDGHVASIFPTNIEEIKYYKGDTANCVLGVYNSPKPPQQRLSMSMEYLGLANYVYIYACGNGKRYAIKSLFDENSHLPCRQICTQSAGKDQKIKIFTDIEQVG